MLGEGSEEDPMAYHNGMKFSTYDEDHDLSPFENCASKYNSGMPDTQADLTTMLCV